MNIADMVSMISIGAMSRTRSTKGWKYGGNGTSVVSKGFCRIT